MSPSYAQQWDWARNISYSYNRLDKVCLASDNNANFYESTNSYLTGCCIEKFDSQGNELWRNYLTGNVAINGITCVSNYVFITGAFMDTIQIGKDTLVSYGLNDVFTACFASNGTFIWAKHFGGLTDDYANGICSDINENIYLTGEYSGTANFGKSNLVCKGTSSMFMAKFNSSGNLLLLKSAGSTDTIGVSKGTKIKIDNFGNIYILGGFIDNDIILDTIHMLGDIGNGTYFLYKLDSLGHAQWADNIGSYRDQLNDITFDNSSNILATGNRYPNHASLTFTQKYNPSGQLLWDTGIGADYAEFYNSNDIATDGFNSFIVGDDVTSYPQGNYFLLAKYDSSGKLIFLDTIRSDTVTSPISGKSIIRDSNGDFIIGGIMNGSLKLGNDSLFTTDNKVFIAKFSGSYSLGTTGSCNPPLKVNIGSDTTIFGCITLYAENASSSFNWSTGDNYSSINVCTSGAYWVTVSNGTCMVSDTINITVKPPVANLGNDSTLSGSMILNAGNAGAMYSWSTGDTSQMITINTPGTYFVTVSNASGSSTDTINLKLLTGINDVSGKQNFKIYPNPNSGVLTIILSTSTTLSAGSAEGQSNEGVYSIMNESGQTIQQVKLNSANKYTINIENLNNGIYFIVGFNNNQMTNQKFVVSK